MKARMNRTAVWCGTTRLEEGTVMTPETHSRYLIKAMLSFGYADLVPKRKPRKKKVENKEADNG